VAESFDKINFLVSKHGFSFREAEKGVLGIDHAELGGMIAERWQFSEKMVDIIRHHHLPMEARFEDEASIVYLADTLCMTMGIGVGSDGLAYRFQKEVLNKLGFTDRDFQEVIAGFGEQISHVEDLVSAT
jgi:HD-like signal output (HDOD) protein